MGEKRRRDGAVVVGEVAARDALLAPERPVEPREPQRPAPAANLVHRIGCAPVNWRENRSTKGLAEE
jgi:hypothetical protein